MNPRLAAFALCAIFSLPGNATITGIVLDQAGKPVANVEVAVFRAEGTRDLLTRITSKTPRRVPLARAKSDAEGSYSLDVAPKEEVDLVVNDPSFTPAQVRLGPGDSVQPLQLERLTPRTGLVTSAGRAVEGAVVLLRGASSTYEVLTDAEGVFTIPDPARWAAVLTVIHPDYALLTQLPGQSLKLTLGRGVAISGKVLATDRSPVPGAELRVDALPSAVTGADGAFTISHASENHREITATSPGRTGRLTGGTGPLTITAIPAASLTVTVRDRDKKPAAGVAVFLAGGERDAMAGIDAVTDARGNVSFPAVPPGEYALGIISAVLEAEEVRFKVRKEAAVTKEIVAREKPLLTGVVRSEDGTVVSGATVLFGMKPDVAIPDEMRGLMEAGMQPLGATDGKGRFAVRVSSANTLLVAAFRRGRPQSPTKEVKAPAAGIVLTIPKGFPVQGRVTADGQPLAGVRVQRAPGAGYGMSGAISMPVWAVTDANGEFSGALAAGSVPLSFGREGFVSTLATVEVKEATARVVITLEPTVGIRGVVRHPDGTPAEGILVWSASQEDVQPSTATSAADGSFSLSVPKGPASLAFGKLGGGRTGQRSVIAPAGDIVLTLPATAVVRGRMVDELGAPVSQFKITALAGKGSDDLYGSPHTFADPSGAFQIDDAPRGTVNLHVVAEGFLPGTKEVSTVTSSEPPLVLTLTRGRTIRGRVSGPDHQPLAGVVVHTNDSEASASVRTDDGGAYELAGLPLADTAVEFSKDGFVGTNRRVSVEDKQLDVELSRGRQVRGKVVDSEGNSMAGASVMASSAAHGAESLSATTDAAGAFQMSGLLAAHYDFSATVGNQKGASSDVDLSRGDEVLIALKKSSHAIVFGKVSGVDRAVGSRSVTVTGDDGTESTGAIDSEGNYRIEDAPAGEVRVSATLYGVSSSRKTADVLSTIAPDSKTRVDLAFQPGIALRGNVTRGGNPVEGASVQFSRDSPYETATVETREGGAYELAGLTPGAYQVRVVAVDPPVTYETRFEARTSGVFDIAMSLVPIEVHAVDSVSGVPLADVAVSTAPLSGSHIQARGKTDQSGSLSFELSPGSADRIVAEKSGYASTAAPVPTGSEPVVVTMIRAEGAMVRLVDARDGQTLSGTVVVRDDAGRVLTSGDKTNPDGSVTMPVLPGTYRFSASATNYGSQTVKATVPGNEVRIGLPRAGKLTIRSKRDVHGAARLIEPDGEEYVRCWCSGIAEIRLDGRITEIDAIAPGAYTLEVTPEGEKAQRFPVSVIEGRAMSVELP